MEELVPGRACGTCNLCCVVPVVDSPELAKPSGAVCRHSRGGCAVYERRPDVCRRFFCAWRRTKRIPDDWRPDRCGVFATLDSDSVPPQFAGKTGISLMLTDNPLKTVRQPWFQDFVADAIARGVPLFLGLPGPAGMQAAMVLLNTPELAAARARSAVKDVLERALKRLSAHAFVPYAMAHDGADVSG
jgi:hypothetical protein